MTLIEAIGVATFAAAIAFVVGFMLGDWRGTVERKLADRETFFND